VVDNRDGAILAYAGSADYFARFGRGKNDGVTALRQPGSSLKPFLYELAFERRIVRPASIIADVPATYALPGLRSFAPGDYSNRFAGPVRTRIALADSLNVPAVRVLSGVQAFLERLRGLGFRHLRQSAEHYGLGLALGDGEVSLEELAAAYVTLARDGIPVHLHALESERGETGAPLGNGTAAWALVTDMLADAHARARAFGVASLLRTPFPSAVKTGTSSDFRDTWTAGFTRAYTVATWVGNFDGSPMRRVSGVTGAAPLWRRIITHLAERSAPQPFAAPRGYARLPICTTTGTRPWPGCPAVAAEWLDAADRIAWNAPPRELDRSYDTWLAMQPDRPDEPLRIVSPHDGDRFVAAPGARIAVVARGAGALRWELNGKAYPGGARWTLALAPGRWTLRAHDGTQSDAVTFTVGPPPQHAHIAGFTVR
jgi:penicillin-binding protein 1C